MHFPVNETITMTFDQDIDDKIQFYGINLIAKQVNGHQPIDFNASRETSNSLNFTLANYSQSLEVFWIYFYSLINCTSDMFWNNLTYTC